MKRKITILALVILTPLLVLLGVFAFVLHKLSETYPDSSTEVTCRDGICVEFNFVEPIAASGPVEVTVRMYAEKDYPNHLLISLQASPSNVTFGEPSHWEYTPKKGESEVFRRTVTFPGEGYWMVGAVIFDRTRGGPVVSNQERLLITSTGAVRNPTLSANPTQEYPHPPRR